mmetsp:Transcript_17701/g.31915  ORF Transcript_17701/g.31915 Transcript_17701/m.31915 type:complete len:437 (+) Transcript_17701:151-1461(+)
MLQDTNCSLAEYSLLSGTAYYLACAVVLMPCGRWADKLQNMKWPLVIGSVLFNATTIATGFASSFAMLLLPRFGTALFSVALEAMFTRLVSLFFPPNSRGAAYGVYMLSVYLGAGLSFLTPPFIEALGWRATFILLGTLGILVALVVGLLFWEEYKFTEEDFADAEKLKHQKLLSEFRTLLKTNRTLSLTTVALAMMIVAYNTRQVFDPTYFIHQFPANKTEYNYLAFGYVVLSPLGPLLGGLFTDLKENSNPRWRPIVCSVTSLAAVPLLFTIYMTESFPLMTSLIYMTSMYGDTFMSVGPAMIQNICPTHMRAFVAGWVLCIANIISAGGAALIGVIGSSHEALRTCLMIVVCGCLTASACIFATTVYTYPKDLHLNSCANTEISNQLLSEDQCKDAILKNTGKSTNSGYTELTHELQKGGAFFNEFTLDNQES